MGDAVEREVRNLQLQARMRRFLAAGRRDEARRREESRPAMMTAPALPAALLSDGAIDAGAGAAVPSLALLCCERLGACLKLLEVEDEEERQALQFFFRGLAAAQAERIALAASSTGQATPETLGLLAGTEARHLALHGFFGDADVAAAFLDAAARTAAPEPVSMDDAVEDREDWESDGDGDGAATLAEEGKLQGLDLAAPGLTLGTLRALSRCGCATRLRHLSLQGAAAGRENPRALYDASGDELQGLLGCFPSLRTLSLPRSPWLDRKNLIGLAAFAAEKLSHLHKIDASLTEADRTAAVCALRTWLSGAQSHDEQQAWAAAEAEEAGAGVSCASAVRDVRVPSIHMFHTHRRRTGAGAGGLQATELWTCGVRAAVGWRKLCILYGTPVAQIQGRPRAAPLATKGKGEDLRPWHLDVNPMPDEFTSFPASPAAAEAAALRELGEEPDDKSCSSPSPDVGTRGEARGLGDMESSAVATYGYGRVLSPMFISSLLAPGRPRGAKVELKARRTKQELLRGTKEKREVHAGIGVKVERTADTDMSWRRA